MTLSLPSQVHKYGQQIQQAVIKRDEDHKKADNDFILSTSVPRAMIADITKSLAPKIFDYLKARLGRVASLNATVEYDWDVQAFRVSSKGEDNLWVTWQHLGFTIEPVNLDPVVVYEKDLTGHRTAKVTRTPFELRYICHQGPEIMSNIEFRGNFRYQDCERFIKTFDPHYSDHIERDPHFD